MLVTGVKSSLAFDLAKDSGSRPFGPLNPPPPGPRPGGPKPPKPPGPGLLGVLFFALSRSSLLGKSNLNVGTKNIPAVIAPGTMKV